MTLFNHNDRETVVLQKSQIVREGEIVSTEVQSAVLIGGQPVAVWPCRMILVATQIHPPADFGAVVQTGVVVAVDICGIQPE